MDIPKDPLKRIKKLYPIWLCISLIGLFSLLYLEKLLQFPYLVFGAVLFFLVKDIFVDLIMRKGPTPLWLEHFPFCLLVVIVYFFGQVDLVTAILAVCDAVLDFIDDLALVKGLQWHLR